jgi:choline dehydrogenase-like flavoprotein
LVAAAETPSWAGTFSRAYLDPVRARSNLEIVGNALVDRVEFSGLNAIGIRVRTAQGVSVVRSAQVVLCAGAIHSPAILMRSGIGGCADLARLGIEPLVELPGVGKNVADHPLVLVRFALQPERTSTIVADCALRLLVCGRHRVWAQRTTSACTPVTWVTRLKRALWESRCCRSLVDE